MASGGGVCRSLGSSVHRATPSSGLLMRRPRRDL